MTLAGFGESPDYQQDVAECNSVNITKHDLSPSDFDHMLDDDNGPSETYIERYVRYARARRACFACPITSECTADAVDDGLTGVYGGTVFLKGRPDRRFGTLYSTGTIPSRSRARLRVVEPT